MQRMTSCLRQALTLCLSASAIAAFTAAASAQPTSAQQSAIRSNCRSDFMSHCSGVTPGGKDALACLQKTVASLSSGCQTAVRATLPPEPKVAEPPAAAPPPPAAAVAPPPAEKPATIVSAPPPPAQPVKRPVKRPAAAAVAPTQLAPPPPPAPAATAEAEPTAAQQNAMRQNCRNDFTSHCRSVTPGGKEALACLQRNVGRLSPACKRVVSATMHGPAPTPAVATAPPPPPPGVEQPEPASAENGFVPGGLLISKACARTVIMRCRGMALDMKRKVACLVDYANSGGFIGPRCKMALTMSGHLR